MKNETWTDRRGRNYEMLVEEGQQPVDGIVIGPPEGLVDDLELPEPFATRIHNALHARGLYNYKILSRNSREILGALQEALSVDAQKIVEAYFKYEREDIPSGG